MEVVGAGVGLVEDFVGGHAFAEGDVGRQRGSAMGWVRDVQEGCAVALLGSRPLFGDDDRLAVVDGWAVRQLGRLENQCLWTLPMPLANILPFSNASLNSAILIPSSSITSLAGRPENSLEKR